MLDRTYKSGDSLDAADVEEIDAQYLYRQGEMFVFMDNASYEQYELNKAIVDETWKWIKEGTVCRMMLFNNNPISVEPPNHMILKVEYCEPAVRGNTATNLTKPVKLETGAEIYGPGIRRHRRHDQGRHPHRRIHRTRESLTAVAMATLRHARIWTEHLARSMV